MKAGLPFPPPITRSSRWLALLGLMEFPDSEMLSGSIRIRALDEKPRTLKFKPADDRPGPSYLNLPEFRLERVLHHKGHNVGFSFFCRQGIQPGDSLLRFDLRTDGDKMFVVYESDGIVHGVMILKKVPRDSK